MKRLALRNPLCSSEQIFSLLLFFGTANRNLQLDFLLDLLSHRAVPGEEVPGVEHDERQLEQVFGDVGDGFFGLSQAIFAPYQLAATGQSNLIYDWWLESGITVAPRDVMPPQRALNNAGTALMQRVAHENICALREHRLLEKGLFSMVLELMDVALDERLVSKDKSPLGWRQRVQIILSVCRALVHLHSLTPKPLIHRDVKSQNVLLLGFEGDELDGESVAKLADFGTVREDTRNSDGRLRTSQQTHASTANVIGTRPYIAPEYARKGHVSEKTDAYSMGVLIIELLISEYFVATDPGVMAHTFCLEARALVKDDIDHLKGDVEEKGIVARIANSALLGATDIFEEGKELAEKHKPASYGIGAVIAAVIGWWALGGGRSDESDDEDYAWDEID